MKWEKCKAYFPPGYHWEDEIKTMIVWMVAAMVYGIRFLPDYWNAYNGLFVHVNINGELEKQIHTGIKMIPFVQLWKDSMWYFAIPILFLVFFGGLHYHYYHKESKSIYLIRRLPDSQYVFRTCFYGPLLGIGMILLYVIALSGIYYGIYLFVTPPQCLP